MLTFGKGQIYKKGSELTETYSITQENIEEFFQCLQAGKELADAWAKSLEHLWSMDEWLQRLTKHNKKLSLQYNRHSVLTTQVLQPLLTGKIILSDELYDFVYQKMRHMYVENYDDPFTLWQISNLLISHYEEKKGVEHLMFCYQAAGYAGLEISRTSDHEKGTASVTLFKKLLSYKGQLSLLKSPESRTSIFIAYSNLIRIENTLDNLSMKKVYKIWVDFTNFRQQEKSHIYDEVLPRIPTLCNFLDDDFKTYCAISYMEEKTNKDASFSASFQPDFYKKLSDICRSYLMPIIEDETHPMHYRPDIYCNYQTMLALEKEITWEEALTRMRDFQALCEHHYPTGSLEEIDPVATVTNPFCRIIYALSHTSYSKEHISDIASEYCEKVIQFSKDNKITDYSYSINSAMELICFKTDLLRCILPIEKKESLITRFIITRHASTMVHSTMVQRISLLVLDYILKQCPETLIGIFCTSSVGDVVKQQTRIKLFLSKAALFHDIGKNALIDIINTEYRKISDNEFFIIKKHPELGASFLSKDPTFYPYRDIALGHHKFYDGKGGYPASFDHTKSPLKPLIDLVALSDCLDAATDNLSRNYQRAKTLSQVLEEFRQGAGTRYHPEYVKLLDTNADLQEQLSALITTERQNIYYDVYRQQLE